MDNELANQHLLLPSEQLALTKLSEAAVGIINNAIKEANLKGTWTVSNDFRWLVKVGE